MDTDQYRVRTYTTSAGIHLHADDLVRLFVDFSQGSGLTSSQAKTLQGAAEMIKEIARGDSWAR